MRKSIGTSAVLVLAIVLGLVVCWWPEPALVVSVIMFVALGCLYGTQSREAPLGYQAARFPWLAATAIATIGFGVMYCVHHYAPEWQARLRGYLDVTCGCEPVTVAPPAVTTPAPPPPVAAPIPPRPKTLRSVPLPKPVQHAPVAKTLPSCFELSFNAPEGGSVRWGVGTVDKPLPPSACNAQRQGDGAWQAWWGECDWCNPDTGLMGDILHGPVTVQQKFYYQVARSRQTIRFSRDIATKGVYLCLEGQDGRQTNAVYVTPKDWADNRGRVVVPDGYWTWN